MLDALAKKGWGKVEEDLDKKGWYKLVGKHLEGYGTPINHRAQKNVQLIASGGKSQPCSAYHHHGNHGMGLNNEVQGLSCWICRAWITSYGAHGRLTLRFRKASMLLARV
jgi:hypothetical protein